MSTRYVNTSGDYYANIWFDPSTPGTPEGPPVAGDTGFIFAGTVTITATDVTNNGTLNNISLQFASTSAATVPVLDVTGETFGAGFLLADFYNGNSGKLVLRGTDLSSGQIQGLTSTGTLTLDIETALGTQHFTNSGTVLASSGNVVVTGTAGALFTNTGTVASEGSITLGTTTSNSGTILAGANTGGNYYVGAITVSGAIDNTGTLASLAFSTLTLSNNVTNESSGTIGTAGGLVMGTVNITGSLTNLGTVTADSGTMTLSGGLTNHGLIAAQDLATLLLSGGVVNFNTITANSSTITLTGGLTNNGLIAAQDFGTVLLSGGIINNGTITDSDSSYGYDEAVIQITGPLTNNGTIIESRGTVSITGSVTGTGTIEVGNVYDSSQGTFRELDLLGGVASTQTIAFTADVGLLKVSAATGFTIATFNDADQIDLVGVAANGTSFNSATGVLTITNNGTAVGTLVTQAGSLNVTSDGNGGSILTLKNVNGASSLVPIMINSPDGVSSRSWVATPGVEPVILYNFDAASNWSSTEIAAFQEAMNLWSAIANVKFVAAVGSQITDGENEILFVRGTDQQAHTTDYTNVHLLNTATISIDTSVASSGWNSLYNLGTADTSGLGNYGFLTVIHELGHALGLYHPGNYNESASIGTQQTDYYDTQQYSLMSYFDAGYSGADRYVSNGGTTTQVFDQTPQLNDIQAIQSIYGASTTLTGGDTFGFNSTFGTMSAHPLREYDFTQNPTPVVTLWDGGTHNTLDLSGFSTDSTVDLRQGQFSSVAGMTDNLSIAFGTTIDTAIGGAGDDIFTLNGDADIVNGGGGSNTVVFTAARAGYTLTNTAGVVTATIGGVTSTFTNVQTLRFTDQTVLASNIPAPCFATGTRIATDQGEIPVERLVEGMRVRLAEGGFAPITWIGHRRVQCRNHPRPWDVMPVHVRANAFGPGRPHAELVLSPDHSVYADGVLVPVRYLLNDATIYQRDTDTITWWHVELDRHAALLAEGLPCESYLDTGNRGAFVNGGVVIQAHPDFALKVWEAESFAPLVTCGPGLVALRTQLLARAEAMGFTTTDDPDVHLIANGVRIDPTWYGDTAQFVLPERVDIVRLVSRSTKPAAILPASDDVRPLGLCISGIELDHRRIALNHPRLTTGWHSEEAGLRWTSGEAALDCTEACLLEITVQRLMAYRDAA